ncbi:MAG: glycosyltransferase family 4 protein [Bacteroidales bacterium]
MTEINEYNDIWDIHATNYLQRSRNRKFNALLTQGIFTRLDICLVMTDVLLKHYSSFPHLKQGIAFLKVPMTVDLKRFNNPEVIDYLHQPYIAYCGSGGFFTNGVDILIRSFAVLSEEFPDTKLYIAAFWGQDGPKMLELIKETGMTERIIYLGSLPRESIPSFLHGAEVLALPRPDSRQAQGGFPTKLGEYLASGRPVCVTKVGEIPAYLQNNESAFLSEPGNIESYVDSLRIALTNRSLAKRVGENGRKVAETVFNMEIQARHIADLLKEKVNSG